MFSSWEENSSWTITSPSSCFHFCCFEGWAGSGCSRLLQHPTPHAACQHAGLLLCVCSVYFLQWMCIASHRLAGTARVLRRADEWLSCRDICQTSVTALTADAMPKGASYESPTRSQNCWCRSRSGIILPHLYQQKNESLSTSALRHQDTFESNGWHFYITHTNTVLNLDIFLFYIYTQTHRCTHI